MTNPFGQYADVEKLRPGITDRELVNAVLCGSKVVMGGLNGAYFVVEGPPGAYGEMPQQETKLNVQDWQDYIDPELYEACLELAKK